MESERFETVVVGGGQSGLAVGHHLAKLGASFVILDAHARAGDAWRRRWDSLRLFTPGKYSSLPGLPNPVGPHAFPTKDEAAEYLAEYARRFRLPVRNGVRVRRVARDGDGFRVASDRGEFAAANVVVATGAFATPKVPAFAADLDARILQLHSSEYRRGAELRPGPALVVGAGNSGAEIALDLAREGRPVYLSGRDTGQELPFRVGSLPDRLLSPVFWFAGSRLLTTETKAGRAMRDKSASMGYPLVRVKPQDLAAAGVERVPRAARVEGGAPVLEDGRALDVANVVWATGFRPDYAWIDAPVFGPDGNPRHVRGVVEEAPGLYFVGLYFQHNLTSSLLGGVGRDAEHVARHIARRQVATARPPVAPRGPP